MPVDGPHVVVDRIENLAGALARRIEELASEAVAARGRFAIALPGGSVASAFLPELRALRVPWDRVAVFFGDERAVAVSHPDSNLGLARSLLLDHVPVDPSSVHPAAAPDGDVDAGAARYESTLLAVLGAPPRLDVALLGVGPDGHVCSLFEGHAALRERDRWVVGVTDSPKPPPRRVTLTLKTLAQARLVAIAAFGAGKAAVMREATSDPASTLPVALAMRTGAPVLVLLDPDASA
ncbi:MAG: 6-phosphogluconolactonase [Acidobacteriota bacterium]